MMLVANIDVVFFCSSYEDEVWVRSTILHLSRFKVKILLLIQNHVPQEILAIYKNSSIKIKTIKNSKLARWCKYRRYGSKVLVTASSNIEKWIFSKKIKYFVHMPHSLVSLHGVYPSNAFDVFNVLFASGPHHVKEFKELAQIRKLRNVKIYETGYGKFDILFNKEVVNCKLINHVLIAPSWGRGNIIETVGLEVVKKALDLGFKVTLRPHCIFFHAKKKFLEPFTNISHPRFNIEKFVDFESLFASSVLITDYSGIAFEYYFVKKRKIIFVDTSPKIFNQDYPRFNCRLVEIEKRANMGVIIPSDVDRIVNAITTTDHYGHQNLAEDFVYNIRSCCSIASKQIMELLAC